jgi:CubicO group peptidase (beta-lactamase class C family)/leucyl aminopeptidase (aminopeptidase T)
VYRYMTLVILSLTSAPLSAQPLSIEDFADRIDAIFAEHDHSDAPGCAVGVSRDGEIVYAKGYGLASVEHGLPNTPQTTFAVGSITKHLTALATFMLEERGVLSRDDDIRMHVPELPDYGTPITIQDLLQHTSGLRDYGALGTLRGRPVATMDDFLDLMARQQSLNFIPGERHAYSHSDYELLGLVIERAVGESFGPFLEREVLRPLGMTASRVHDHRAAPVPNRAFGHRTAADGYAVAFPGPQLVGGVGLYTTVEDLLRWERHFQTGIPDRQALADQLLERPALRSGEPIPYAYGLKHGGYRGLATVNRSAGGSFATEFMRFPEQRLAVVTLCNVLPSHPLYLSREVAEVFLEELMEPAAAADALQTVPTPADELARYAGIYRPLVDRWNLLTLVVQEDALAEIVGDEAVSLDRLSDGRYETSGIVFTFTPPADGGAVRLTLSMDDEVLEELDRVATAELWRPDAAGLAEYAGAYHSSDLDVSWTLAVVGTELVVQRRRGESERLAPASPDVFMRAFGPNDRPVYAGLHFARDAAGRVTHFTLDTPAGEDAAQGLVFRRAQTVSDVTSPVAAEPLSHPGSTPLLPGVWPTVDLRAVAKTVAGNAMIRPGELVWIRGGTGDLAFMEQLAVATAALGGQPLVHVFSDATLRQWYEDVPTRFDGERDEWAWSLWHKADVVLEFGRRDPKIWSELPPERLDAYDTVNAGLETLRRQRGVRRMWLGNGGIYPSEAYARMFGISLAEIEGMYWTGLATDPALLAAVGNRLRAILENASVIHVRDPNGTDITVRPGRGSIVVSDGTIPPAPDSVDAAPPSETWLPGGEVTMALDLESAEGRMVIERVYFDGENIGPLSLDFSGGRLQAMESDKDLSSFGKYVRTTHPLSDRLSGLKFGLNPYMTDQRVLPFMGAGMFSLSMGMNSHLGGDLDMPFLVFLTLAESTVHVDGQLVVEDGRLML